MLPWSGPYTQTEMGQGDIAQKHDAEIAETISSKSLFPGPPLSMKTEEVQLQVEKLAITVTGGIV